MNSQFAVTVLMTVFVTNAILTGVKVALEKIKDKTETKADDNLYVQVSKAVDATGTVIDWITGNKDHSGAVVSQEVKK